MCTGMNKAMQKNECFSQSTDSYTFPDYGVNTLITV
jgi:hypothetical protein